MATITINLNENDITELDNFCNNTGLSIESLFNVYVKKIISQKKLPFDVIFNTQKKQDLISESREGLFKFINECDPVNFLDTLNSYDIWPTAVILSYMDSSKASIILENLPEKTRFEIIKLLAKSIKISDKIAKAIEDDLIEKLNKQINSTDYICGNINNAVEILNLANRSMEKEIIENLEENDPECAEEIKKRMFVFEDIIMLDDRSVQKVLREVDQQELAKALKSVDTQVQDKIFKNMSKRAANMLKEDIEFMGPIRLKDADEAQIKIVNIIRKLEDNGEIVIAKYSDDQLVN